MRTCDLLDAVLRRYQLSSNYALSRFLGITKTAVYRYRNHGGTMDDAVALRVAELLDLDPALVLLWVHAERTDCPPARQALSDAANRLKPPRDAA